jgi:tetratricopeptide (TPR) repeat protein
VFRLLTKRDEKDAQASGWLNLARVFQADARFADAANALHEAQERGAPWWTVAWFDGLVNAENGNFEDAVRDFETILDPATQPRDARRDFTKDYVVINELGQTLYNLAQQSANEPEQRDDYLRRAVERFERTLELDSEDLDAHFYLSKCYNWLGRGMPATADPAGPAPADEKGLLDLAGALANGKAPRDSRLQAARQLGRGVTAFGQQPMRPNAPKLPTLLALRRLCREVYRSDPDAGVKLAAAHALGHVYRETHAIYKPDDNAQDEAVATYRENHPAAAQASYAVVVYPTAPR